MYANTSPMTFHTVQYSLFSEKIRPKIERLLTLVANFPHLYITPSIGGCNLKPRRTLNWEYEMKSGVGWSITFPLTRNIPIDVNHQI